MFHRNVNDSSLSEELSYWDFSNEPRPHIILNDGSLVSGIKLSLLDIECFDDNSVNPFFGTHYQVTSAIKYN